jgi:hypothetical protein
MYLLRNELEPLTVKNAVLRNVTWFQTLPYLITGGKLNKIMESYSLYSSPDTIRVMKSRASKRTRHVVPYERDEKCT